VYHTFVVECDRRDELQSYLAVQGIKTKVHYPIPIHLQGAARVLGYKPGDFPVTEQQAGHILSLPVYPELSRQQLEWVASAIETFYGDGIES
jgi:dTDP-4-amino-4,6-dideoxygalactose transaminase